LRATLGFVVQPFSGYFDATIKGAERETWQKRPQKERMFAKQNKSQIPSVPVA